MQTRIEILKNGSWVEIMLNSSDPVRYNAVINRIGKISHREIGHSNTFSIPNVYQNISALDLTRFNPGKMAKALNKKYNAKYFIDDKIIRTGFIVINNVTEGSINVNFIDGSLDIVEKWGSMTYYELLNSSSLDIPSDYQAAITEMRDYHMDKANVLAKLSNVGTRGYRLGVFPNTLNTYGDKFQTIKEDGQTGGRTTHPEDAFNPYQSRPVFGVQALLDLATESFGYTATFDSSIDWTVVKKSFIVAAGMTKGEETDGSGALQTLTSVPVASENEYHTVYSSASDTYEVNTAFVYANNPNNVKRPVDIDNFTYPPNFYSDIYYKNCVYSPDMNNSNSGTVKWTADIVNTDLGAGSITFDCYALYKNTTAGDDIVWKTISATTNNGTATTIDFTINKSDTVTPPTNGGDFIGMLCQSRLQNSDGDTQTLENLVVTETYIPMNAISFDDFGQYEENYVDLTFGAPKTTIKELLASIMQKEGMLISINSDIKTVKLFSYKQYENQKNAGNYYDWSSYLQKYSGINYNTNYGNEYAKDNKIGLSDPFSGNSYKLLLTNQGEGSKYKDYAENLVKGFKDVSKVVKVNGSDAAHTYYEYENHGQGLVETDGTIAAMEQIDITYDGTNGIGTLTDLDIIANVNYAVLPDGVSEWYQLIDKAVRIEAPYLLPTHVIKDFDITKPIYDEFLGGFFIVEEIPEYINSQTIVRVKLIKLIDFT